LSAERLSSSESAERQSWATLATGIASHFRQHGDAGVMMASANGGLPHIEPFALFEAGIRSIGKMITVPKFHASSTRPHITPHNSLILVGDGQKALFVRNRGGALDVDLVVEQILEQDNPATREQGTDRPGRSTASPAVARSAMEEVDWHHIAKERFANEIAETLYRQAHANLFDRLIIIAPPKILGQLRKACHAEVVARIAAEIPKELTSHPISEIRKLVAA
jgi:protein required for attachment to host cells